MDGYVIGERCHWGSPTVGELKARIGDDGVFRDVLRFHADVNRVLFGVLPPLLIWAPGVSTCVQEAVEDYRLKEIEVRRIQGRRRTETLWRHYESDDGVPFLFSKHPTGARLSHEQHSDVFQTLGRLAQSRR